VSNACVRMCMYTCMYTAAAGWLDRLGHALHHTLLLYSVCLGPSRVALSLMLMPRVCCCCCCCCSVSNYALHHCKQPVLTLHCD
jgi:hypothetical protein